MYTYMCVNTQYNLNSNYNYNNNFEFPKITLDESCF